jgi:hypothetical protein
MIEEAFQASGAARMASDAQVHADGQHLGLCCAFARHQIVWVVNQPIEEMTEASKLAPNAKSLISMCSFGL